MSIGVGDPAPDFTLAGSDGSEQGRREYTLSAYMGQPVVLVFYPGDNSPICTRQLTTYAGGLDRFSEVGAQVLAVSPQSVESHEGFSARHGGFGFPLLADADKAVGEAYGILGPMGFYRRSVFVVDPSRRVAYVHRAVAGLTYRPIDELVEAVRHCVPTG